MNLRRETFLLLPLLDLRDSATAERFAPDYASLREQAHLLQLAGPARRALAQIGPPDDGEFRRDMGLRRGL